MWYNLNTLVAFYAVIILKERSRKFVVTRRKTKGKFCFTNYFSSKESTIDPSNMLATSHITNGHHRVEDEFSKSMAGEFRSSIYIYIWKLGLGSSFGTRIDLYTPRYQKLSYLSRSNVIRDVDSRG